MAVRTDFAAGEVLAAQDLDDTFASKLNLAGGKVLQVVRATDATQRTTLSTSFVDVTGMSVTITPQKSTSAILIIMVASIDAATSGNYLGIQIADSSNNAISGAEGSFMGPGVHQTPAILIAYATPGTTSAVTYKARFKADSGTVRFRNEQTTGQIYAIEVSA